MYGLQYRAVSIYGGVEIGIVVEGTTRGGLIDYLIEVLLILYWGMRFAGGYVWGGARRIS